MLVEHRLAHPCSWKRIALGDIPQPYRYPQLTGNKRTHPIPLQQYIEQGRSGSSPTTNYATPSPSEINLKPWKYLGYRAFSEWAASSDDFFIVRRFKSLNTRVIFQLQDDISRLETELETLDVDNSRLSSQDVDNGTLRHDQIERRTQILRDSFSKLKDYSKPQYSVSIQVLGNPFSKS